MALLAMYGFEGAPDVAPGITINTGSITADTGRDGTGKSVRGSSGTPALTVPIGSAVSTLIAQWAFKVNLAAQAGNTADGVKVIGLYGDSGVTNHLTLNINASNQLQVRRGGPTGTVIATESGSRTDGAWAYIELKVTIADSGGTCIVRANGVEVINFTGDTKNAGTNTSIDALRFGLGTPSPGWVPIDDLIIMDGTGSSMNDFVGDHAIKAIRPNGDGASSQWLGSDGNSTNNYQLVDETTFSSSDYVADSTAGHQDLYAFEDISTTGAVKAVKPVIFAAKSDAGTRSVKAVKRNSGGTTATSSSLALSTTYAILSGPIWETDAAGSAWTVSTVNSHQFGVETV